MTHETSVYLQNTVHGAFRLHSDFLMLLQSARRATGQSGKKIKIANCVILNILRSVFFIRSLDLLHCSNVTCIQNCLTMVGGNRCVVIII